jgi:hypothetical protein
LTTAAAAALSIIQRGNKMKMYMRANAANLLLRPFPQTICLHRDHFWTPSNAKKITNARANKLVFTFAAADKNLECAEREKSGRARELLREKPKTTKNPSDCFFGCFYFRLHLKHTKV